MGFSKGTLKLLHEAGWWKDRALDKEEIEAYLIAHDYPVYPAVVDFFSEFGSLIIGLYVDSARVGDSGHRAVTEENYLGLGFFLFYAGDGGKMNLYSAAQGQIYGAAAYKNYTYFVGNDAIEAIGALCSNAKFSRAQITRPGKHS